MHSAQEQSVLWKSILARECVKYTLFVTVQPGGLSYIVKIEKIKNLLVRFIHQKIFFKSILVIDFEIVYKFSDLYAYFRIFCKYPLFYSQSTIKIFRLSTVIMTNVKIHAFAKNSSLCYYDIISLKRGDLHEIRL